MTWLNRLSAVIIGLISVGVVRQFFSKYDLILFDKMDVDQARQEQDLENNVMDLRGTPTHACVCGCREFYVRAIFDDYEIATYFLDMQCASCGSFATAPTLLDKETTE